MSLQKKQRLISMFIVTAPPGVRWINHGRKWNTGSPIHSGRHLASVRHKGELAVELHVGDCEGPHSPISNTLRFEVDLLPLTNDETRNNSSWIVSPSISQGFSFAMRAM